MTDLKDDVLAALEKVSGPDGSTLSATGKLSDIVASDGKVFMSITVDAAAVKPWEAVRERAEAAIRAVPGVKSVMVALTAERAPGAPPGGRHGTAAAAPTGGARPARAPGRKTRPGARSSFGALASPAFRASPRSLRLPPAKAVSANRPPRSIWRSACAISG